MRFFSAHSFFFEKKVVNLYLSANLVRFYEMMKDLVAKDINTNQLDVLFPHNPESSRLLVGCPAQDYSASAIARAVEDADARLINLNVTSLGTPPAGVVALRVGHISPERVARSLERYGYEILSVECDDTADDTLRRRYGELMKMLDI